MTQTNPASLDLPADLLTAEKDMLQSTLAAVGSGDGRRWAASLRFEGLRLLPVAVRLARDLIESGQQLVMVWPDAGAAALARRDAEDLKDVILDFNQLKRAEPETPDTRLLLAVNPSPADYEEFQALCENHAGAILMLNGRLEDAAVGIGSVARERRKGFVASWQQAYWLQPLEGGALMRCFPDDWRLYRQDPDGFRQLDVLSERPDPDTTSALLAGEDPDSIKQQLSGVDRFLDGLRN